MAIAFYIPDQNKLLASYSGSNNNNNSNGSNSSSSSGGNNNNNSTTSATPTQQAAQQQTNSNHPSNPNSPNHSSGTHVAAPNFRANITIPLANYGNGRSTANEANAVGCWELFAQVFCYALGCYRATMLNPTAIQISFEISSSSSVAGFLTAEPTTLAAAATTGTTTATATSTEATPTPPTSTSTAPDS